MPSYAKLESRCDNEGCLTYMHRLARESKVTNFDLEVGTHEQIRPARHPEQQCHAYVEQLAVSTTAIFHADVFHGDVPC